ncbi:MAG: zinc ribbon domain-containing protein [Methanobrevibacter sp.]|jgi:hypothetical protein|uniref:zinc ribbon domain-containing protein n=1 Tax=Methanobrevibacter sp. TaxID=66852 RepID=UPI0025FC95B8|nr:zinc ribbon domain-containing protein [Methanobrevibacter sp.]MBE6497241.1 zinc ribbon domain-containing protein [Methanobrevibacter sp.]
MVLRRCPQCGSTSDDAYGFCIKCGREFPKIEVSKNSCPLCGFQNPNEADFCVKCGTPLVFKNNVENGNVVQPIVINRPDEQVMPPVQNRIETDGNEPITTFQKILVFFGYLFSILGGILGVIIGIYLSTRKNPSLKRHGHIQLAIFGFYVVIIAILFLTGNIPTEAFTNYTQLIGGNFTGI